VAGEHVGDHCGWVDDYHLFGYCCGEDEWWAVVDVAEASEGGGEFDRAAMVCGPAGVWAMRTWMPAPPNSVPSIGSVCPV